MNVTALAQRAAQRRMGDTCLIEYATGETTDDEGRVTTLYATRYSGICRVQMRARSSEPRDAGAQLVSLLEREVQVPVAVIGIQVKDRVTITSVAAGSDPDLVGRQFHVDQLFGKTDASARRFPCTEVTA